MVINKNLVQVYEHYINLITSGTNNAHFDYASGTGVLTVATGTTIANATVSSYTLTLTATPGGTVSSAAGTATLTVNVKPTCNSGAAQFIAGLGIYLTVTASLLL